MKFFCEYSGERSNLEIFRWKILTWKWQCWATREEGAFLSAALRWQLFPLFKCPVLSCVKPLRNLICISRSHDWDGEWKMFFFLTDLLMFYQFLFAGLFNGCFHGFSMCICFSYQFLRAGLLTSYLQGFSMIGESTTSCQTNSTWSSPPPRLWSNLNILSNTCLFLFLLDMISTLDQVLSLVSFFLKSILTHLIFSFYRCDAITCPPQKLSHAVRVYNNASFKVTHVIFLRNKMNSGNHRVVQ